eukprot:CAMPEP_0179626754 /NCGR_PEP_ID=MMETSP0932-20121108/3984_1 /TAXON_ID=548131 ORGANISM="Ostreococcus mediterraneus, Strain clade-D-RCC2596" /NCGR_SAMPLE_ID=MMETSP0932 /ASSEMBLY_ACC=CAM_ASM_000582 /LENGTH=199 /DNA_ID=CAMNT_0021496071 /DNA_START=53 /DNA_END=649 /DNA_ORIENTATION=+
MRSTSAEKTPANDFHTNGINTFTNGIATNNKFNASFSLASQSRARNDGTVNIHTLHIPINRAIDGSSLGAMTLNANNPPTTIAAYACTSNTVYNTLPLYAGFFFAVLERGANVVAVFFANLLKFFSKSASEIVVVVVVVVVDSPASSSDAFNTTDRRIAIAIVIIARSLFPDVTRRTAPRRRPTITRVAVIVSVIVDIV